MISKSIGDRGVCAAELKKTIVSVGDERGRTSRGGREGFDRLRGRISGKVEAGRGGNESATRELVQNTAACALPIYYSPASYLLL